MTGSPFSNVLASKTDSGAAAPSFHDVESTQVSDTTTETAGRPQTDGSESSVGVWADGAHDTHVSGEDETQGQTDVSGTNVTGT